MCSCMCESQRKTSDDLLSYFLPYSLETESLTKPDDRTATSKSQQSSCLHPPSFWGYRHMYSHSQLFTRVLEIELRFSYLHSKHYCILNPVPSQCLASWHCNTHMLSSTKFTLKDLKMGFQNKNNVLGKFTILCWATFIAILRYIWPMAVGWTLLKTITAQSGPKSLRRLCL